MQALEIKKFPDPILRKKASKILRITAQVKDTLSEMAKLMYLAQGVGLAAQQVGIDKQLAVIDVGEGLIKLVNPVIVKRKGHEQSEEGCLSVPGISVAVKRYRSVTVHFMDEEGIARGLDAEGLLSRAIQHELDHLHGILIIDHTNPVRKMLLKKRFLKISLANRGKV